MRDMGDDSVDPRHFKLVEQMHSDGRFGRKAGKGFYEYPAKPAKKSLWPGLKEMFEQKPADEVDFEELKQRFLVTMALEAARTIEEGVVNDPREADVGSILGFGFAPYTGGTISYIDGMGVKAFVALCEKLEGKYGERFRPTPLLREMAEKNQTFYGRFAPRSGGQGRLNRPRIHCERLEGGPATARPFQVRTIFERVSFWLRRSLNADWP